MRENIIEIIEILEELYPDPVCSLDYEHPWQLLFSARLAAQCTDARVNTVTPGLFAKYPTAQAMAAAERFLDSAVPDRRVEDILLEMERDTRNLLLVGMPGCGKTAVGKALAQRLGRRLVDTDERIVELAGCSIPEIFASQGEDAFRRLEHRALCSAAKESGLVIATGGGIVTRPFNHDPIRQNSTVIFLRRELDQLSVEGRPLSQANRLADLYRQRLPLYQKVADITVDNITVEGAADEIIGRLSL